MLLRQIGESYRTGQQMRSNTVHFTCILIQFIHGLLQDSFSNKIDLIETRLNFFLLPHVPI